MHLGKSASRRWWQLPRPGIASGSLHKTGLGDSQPWMFGGLSRRIGEGRAFFFVVNHRCQPLCLAHTPALSLSQVCPLSRRPPSFSLSQLTYRLIQHAFPCVIPALALEHRQRPVRNIASATSSPFQFRQAHSFCIRTKTRRQRRRTGKPDRELL